MSQSIHSFAVFLGYVNLSSERIYTNLLRGRSLVQMGHRFRGLNESLGQARENEQLYYTVRLTHISSWANIFRAVAKFFGFSTIDRIYKEAKEQLQMIAGSQNLEQIYLAERYRARHVVTFVLERKLNLNNREVFSFVNNQTLYSLAEVTDRAAFNRYFNIAVVDVDQVLQVAANGQNTALYLSFLEENSAIPTKMRSLVALPRNFQRQIIRGLTDGAIERLFDGTFLQPQERVQFLRALLEHRASIDKRVIEKAIAVMVRIQQGTREEEEVLHGFIIKALNCNIDITRLVPQEKIVDKRLYDALNEEGRRKLIVLFLTKSVVTATSQMLIHCYHEDKGLVVDVLASLARPEYYCAFVSAFCKRASFEDSIYIGELLGICGLDSVEKEKLLQIVVEEFLKKKSLESDVALHYLLARAVEQGIDVKWCILDSKLTCEKFYTAAYNETHRHTLLKCIFLNFPDQSYLRPPYTLALMRFLVQDKELVVSFLASIEDQDENVQKYCKIVVDTLATQFEIDPFCEWISSCLEIPSLSKTLLEAFIVEFIRNRAHSDQMYSLLHRFIAVAMQKGMQIEEVMRRHTSTITIERFYESACNGPNREIALLYKQNLLRLTLQILSLRENVFYSALLTRFCLNDKTMIRGFLSSIEQTSPSLLENFCQSLVNVLHEGNLKGLEELISTCNKLPQASALLKEKRLPFLRSSLDRLLEKLGSTFECGLLSDLDEAFTCLYTRDTSSNNATPEWPELCAIWGESLPRLRELAERALKSHPSFFVKSLSFIWKLALISPNGEFDEHLMGFIHFIEERMGALIAKVYGRERVTLEDIAPLMESLRGVTSLVENYAIEGRHEGFIASIKQLCATVFTNYYEIVHSNLMWRLHRLQRCSYVIESAGVRYDANEDLQITRNWLRENDYLVEGIKLNLEQILFDPYMLFYDYSIPQEMMTSLQWQAAIEDVVAHAQAEEGQTEAEARALVRQELRSFNPSHGNNERMVAITSLQRAKLQYIYQHCKTAQEKGNFARQISYMRSRCNDGRDQAIDQMISLFILKAPTHLGGKVSQLLFLRKQAFIEAHGDKRIFCPHVPEFDPQSKYAESNTQVPRMLKERMRMGFSLPGEFVPIQYASYNVRMFQSQGLGHNPALYEPQAVLERFFYGGSICLADAFYTHTEEFAPFDKDALIQLVKEDLERPSSHPNKMISSDDINTFIQGQYGSDLYEEFIARCNGKEGQTQYFTPSCLLTDAGIEQILLLLGYLKEGRDTSLSTDEWLDF